MELILMGTRDARRLGVIQAALDGKLTNQAGADSLRISRSQFKRRGGRSGRTASRVCSTVTGADLAAAALGPAARSGGGTADRGGQAQ